MNTFVRSSLSFVRPTILRSLGTSSGTYKDGFDDLFHPDGKEPTIPKYPQHKAETIDIKKARLVYQSRKRGMLENGLILSTFAKKYLDIFDDSQLQLYDELINLPSNDWDIFYWATGVKPIPPEFDNEVMGLLKKHIKNEDRQARIMQPDL